MNKSMIGTNAGIIWQYLDNKGECATVQLRELLNMNEKEYYMALGWLAREDKIVFYMQEDDEYVFLKF